MSKSFSLALFHESTVLITGGHGFIGSHVARALYQSQIPGLIIRIVDQMPKPTLFEGVDISHESIIGNLHDPYTLQSAIDGVKVVLHFAANMGGMGTIHHSSNDFHIYSDNHTMTINLVQACLAAGVQRFLYASTACVSPERLHQDRISSFSSVHASFREDDAVANATAELPPQPQGLYGLEKLNTELLLNQFSGSAMTIQIARFHNVYGPGGAYENGRENAPAALLRKAVALTLAEPDAPKTLEIWCDGSQRRSFLYINDAVSAVLKLLKSDYTHPLDIGSNQFISIRDLSEIALRSLGLDPQDVHLHHEKDRPVGVASRNPNDGKAKETLDWEPTTSMEEGMRETGRWIESQVRRALPREPRARDVFVRRLKESQVVEMAFETTSFAILLPITSRSSDPPSRCLDNLKTFAESLIRTTREDILVSRTIRKGGKSYRVRIYLAIDHDGTYLLPHGGSSNDAERVLRALGFPDIKTLICKHPRGHVCALWRNCAREAWKDKCDYFVLLGDNAVMEDEGWMGKVDDEFHNISSGRGVPLGTGCVAFTDTSSPGMPTFPVIHRRHMDIFDGEVVPDIFVNQDGDAFLFQLYRRWSCSTMIQARVSNAIGGSDDARYEKERAHDWTFDTLENAVQRVENALSPNVQRTLTLDVVIPCYRVDLSILSTILQLESSPTCSVMFIIIIDNPESANTPPLEKMFGHRVDVRIRVNKTNMGASASRNRGMVDESAAEWVFFLDDDVIPNPDLLFEAEASIREQPNAAGFVGTCKFPCATTIFQSAVHLSNVTYFWDIAEKIDTDLPWGITANLIVRRNVKDGVVFDLRYPKTGGGEDIHFCRVKREASLKRGGVGFEAAPKVMVTHLWWNGGKRSYSRFYRWSRGDGALVMRFPDLSYTDYAPNSAESLAICLVVPLLALPFFISHAAALVVTMVEAIGCILVVNVVHDLFSHLWRDPERNANINSSVKGGPRFWAALVEGTIIRMVSEVGRTRGVIDRREWGALGRRFDWFAGRREAGPRAERQGNVERFILCVLLIVAIRFR